MPALELEAKLSILDQAMKRLEGELRHDEHWRALNQPVSADVADPAAMDARNTRLRLALEANPVYRAWKDVKDVTDLLRAKDPQPVDEVATEEDAPPPHAPEPAPAAEVPPQELASPDEPLVPAPIATADPPVEAAAPSPPPDDLAAHYELPEELANLIREELELVEREASVAEPTDEAAAVGARATRAIDRLLDIPEVEPVSAEQLEEARRRAAAFDRKPRRGGLSERLAGAKDPAEHENTHSVPLAAEDLAFLLSPSTAPTKAAVRKPAPERKPFLQRLTAEDQVPRPITQAPAEEAEVTVVRRVTGTPPPQADGAETAKSEDEGREKAARLSQLLKAWNRS
ncbi:MAG: hypothetical protein EKK41_04795 [Hyphomicrobiales bacterium]|nr:MAG: hypothetical protein EKK41_04795 [Hyphomicrobiales bacterium]